MATLLKRKRSAELCDNSMMVLDAPALHSRTLKRYRDNRPSDEEVHRKFYEWRAHHHLSPNLNSCLPAEHTLDLLYSAQQRPQGHQQPQDAVIVAQSESERQPAANANSNGQHQQSLHKFWDIGSEPSSGTSSPGIANPCAPPTNCDDCGAALAGSDDDMDVDGGSAQDTACGACGKHVCFSCSVSNLGEQKRCLQCAGRRVWIGGIGWTNAGVSVC
ncbi:uncharacterized protein Triagg1_1085 [Trichoderma aggressivum f. europaeum]|uniref:Uncharacterized protein n=1 Tax=Trichoderma aggressivum f. europaeum TaxID=173218 RepID=A0AAE1M4Q9_9HYPO|nr:hypothetical protein Triagg1_1085 [Trichoderma aggressivum f. europaeum]